MRVGAAVCGLAVAVLAVGCDPRPNAKPEHYEGKLQQLHGRSIDEVMRAWGPPQQEARMNSGSRMVKFRRMMPTFLSPRACETTFEVDGQGLIVSHLFSGVGCRVRPADDLGLGLR